MTKRYVFHQHKDNNWRFRIRRRLRQTLYNVKIKLLYLKKTDLFSLHTFWHGKPTNLLWFDAVIWQPKIGHRWEVKSAGKKTTLNYLNGVCVFVFL